MIFKAQLLDRIKIDSVENIIAIETTLPIHEENLANMDKHTDREKYTLLSNFIKGRKELLSKLKYKYLPNATRI